MLGFLICLNKNKYGWISLEYARICLKWGTVKTKRYPKESPIYLIPKIIGIVNV